MSWALALDNIETPAHPEALADVHPLLERLVKAFGVRPLAVLLDADPSTVANWRSGHRRLSEEMAERVIDLHDVMMRALRVFQPDTAVRWFFGNEPFLDHNRPIDVLALRGAAPLIDALKGIQAGAYA